MLTEKEIILRLVLAVVLGGMIGLERERLYVSIRTYSAGFRTHILVCVGAALAMVVSEGLHYQFRGDAARVAAQVVSGIGFLGAGAILREGPLVRGLTTAASLWVVACVGLAAGGGFYLAATLGTVLVLFALVILGAIEDYVRKRQQEDVLNLVVASAPEDIQRVGTLLGEFGLIVKNIEVEKMGDGERHLLKITVQFRPHVNRVLILNKLASLPGVYRVEHRHN
ncbi:putative Mg2+ transporter-C (MgtC) family protein [Desulfofundulus australicus DSM 11792]|uniref:Putative Mg2+ transporter-C (MgtC) family protein n=1 Tax=Desulfofundulus australicus DSM 11792 TaxID=1121425 RepID=A0A1M4UQ41_9FIRM|nr:MULTISPECIES: MgtC/SapB family protein [Desulfofundulus]MDK2887168.1 putative Mg2+ transporter-C (MgtC) family protein [Thermoanaerobacter sp.]SHE58799.1 putative Mg2+ transporter-C (MgtC) family protein [Desulfofundulus australicus DSM 11792]